MACIRGRILNVTKTDMEWNVSILLEKRINVLPGQYLKVRQPENDQLLSTTVFHIFIDDAQLEVMPLSQPTWSVGDEVQLHGPFGKGFTLPNHKSRVGIFVPEATPALCLLPLIEQASLGGHEIALVCDSFITGLLAEVEVLTSDRAQEVWQWADYLAVIARINDVATIVPQIIPYRNHINRSGEDELLVLTEMPCSGIAVCEMCAVQTKKGWKHACKDGPVFNLAEVGSI